MPIALCPTLADARCVADVLEVGAFSGLQKSVHRTGTTEKPEHNSARLYDSGSTGIRLR
jgi:hypothetical protein